MAEFSWKDPCNREGTGQELGVAGEFNPNTGMPFFVDCLAWYEVGPFETPITGTKRFGTPPAMQHSFEELPNLLSDGHLVYIWQRNLATIDATLNDGQITGQRVPGFAMNESRVAQAQALIPATARLEEEMQKRGIIPLIPRPNANRWGYLKKEPDCPCGIFRLKSERVPRPDEFLYVGWSGVRFGTPEEVQRILEERVAIARGERPPAAPAPSSTPDPQPQSGPQPQPGPLPDGQGKLKGLLFLAGGGAALYFGLRAMKVI